MPDLLQLCENELDLPPEPLVDADDIRPHRHLGYILCNERGILRREQGQRKNYCGRRRSGNAEKRKTRSGDPLRVALGVHHLW